VLAAPEQTVGAMNGDIQSARKLLAELKGAYRGLPQHIQVHVTCLLRDSTLQKQPKDRSVSCDSPGSEGIMNIQSSASNLHLQTFRKQKGPGGKVPPNQRMQPVGPLV
jgi:hypothetical protein